MEIALSIPSYKVMPFRQMQLMLTLATVIQPTATKALKRKHDQTLQVVNHA